MSINLAADKENKSGCASSCGDKLTVGGQAVMEGVMMRSPDRTAVCVRQPSGKIVARVKENVPLAKRFKPLGWPIIRGVVNFVFMLVIGVRTLTESAEMAGLDAEEPTEFEKKLAARFGKSAEDLMMGVAVVLALGLSIGLFFIVPTLVESLIKHIMTGGNPDILLSYGQKLGLNLIGGCLRIMMFIGYILLVRNIKEIKRTFMYHGSEHKSVHCYEAGLELTVENVQKQSRLHPRCGTSFVFIVFFISIIVYILFGANDSGVLMRVVSRLLLLPLIAGVSYEVLQGLAKAKDNKLVRALKWPGMQLQRLTTAEPDDAMCQVAIESLKCALNTEDCIKEQFELASDKKKAEKQREAA